MNKKVMGLLLVLMAGVVLVLGACSSGNNDGDGNAQGGSEDNNNSERTLKVWGLGGEGETLKGFAESFGEESDINIEVQSIPWSEAQNKIATAIASGQGPDVLQAPMTWIPQYGEAGTFLDLTELIDDYENLSQDNFFEESAASTVVNDQILAIPWFASTRVIYYRTDLLEEVGYPGFPKTWDELVDAGSKLAARGEGQYGFQIAPEDGNVMFLIARQFGLDFDIDKGAANFDDPAFKEMIQLYKKLFGEGIVQFEEGKELLQAFSEGSKPMFLGAEWDLNGIKENTTGIDGKWDIGLLPKAENNLSSIGGTQLAVFDNAENEDEALEFLNYMADPETQVAWYEAQGSLPAVKAAWDDPILADDPYVSTLGEQLESTSLPLMYPEYEQLASELVKTMERIIIGDADIDEEIANYKETVSNILE